MSCTQCTQNRTSLRNAATDWRTVAHKGISETFRQKMVQVQRLEEQMKPQGIIRPAPPGWDRDE
jgi:hypothetical protein